jgi:hypothetical protein
LSKEIPASAVRVATVTVIEGPAASMVWSGSVEHVAGSALRQEYTVSSRKPQGGVPMHVSGGEMVHETGGFEGDSKWPALSFRRPFAASEPTFTAAIWSQLRGPPAAPEATPIVVIEAVR